MVRTAKGPIKKNSKGLKIRELVNEKDEQGEKNCREVLPR